MCAEKPLSVAVHHTKCVSILAASAREPHLCLDSYVNLPGGSDENG